MASLAAVSVSTKAFSTVSCKNVQLKSNFTTSLTLPTRKITTSRSSSVGPVTCFKCDWLRKDLSVVGFGLVGWLVPSSIPAINGDSLTGLFFKSIGPELAKFPVGPSLDSPFWLWLTLWHIGLFTALLLGQIGFKGRKDGLFS